MKLKSQTQQFNDGIANIYTVGNIAQAGNMPKEGLTLKVDSLRYEEKTVGMSRFWAASQEQTKIARLLRLPRIEFIDRADVVIPIDGKQYKIVQVQYPPDTEPQCMDLSLERLEVAYEVG
jgi:hypothetical protein